ncbi:sigma-54-dependent Fis family transcriptional regulator [bacterium]|nr:sigma-54-dependent Fis family transcriptional regulator [bacterium]
MTKILLVGVDDKTALSLREAVAQRKEYVIDRCKAEEAQILIERSKPGIIFLNIARPEVSRLHLLQTFKRDARDVPVIVIAERVSTSLAIKAMKEGAFDYVIKPLDKTQLRALLEKLARTRQKAPSKPALELEEDMEGETVFIGEHPEMLEIYKLIGRVAPTDVPVLIQGETGTGKELVAQEIHRHSLRGHKRLLAVNCAAIPETLLESELFGHEAGAFTGAMGRRKGKFEQADGGTIFLDEVTDMSPATQSKVLRVLEQQEFERLGGAETIKVDIRIITATNRSLVKCMQEGGFRVDLFYRLRGAFICLPPLRSRGEDVCLIAEYFLRQFSEKTKKNIKSLHPRTVKKLKEYSWKGNIRELRNVIQTAVIFCHGEVLLPEHIFLEEEIVDSGEIQDDCQQMFTRMIEPLFDKLRVSEEGHLYQQLTSALERALIQITMEKVGKNQVKAAQLLGVSRNTLRDRLKKFGLS